MNKIPFHVVLISNSIYYNMQNDLISVFESCQSQIYNSICNNGRVEKENALVYATSHIPNMKEELKGYWEAWKRQVIGRWYYECDIHKLKDESLEMNLRFCVDIINIKLNTFYSQPISCYAMQILFFSPDPLPRDKVIYTKENKELTVSDFLSVLSYAKKYTETCMGIHDKNTDKALLAIKTVELAVNHKKEDKPLNKALHIVNDVFTMCAKQSTDDNNSKKAISDISLLLDLAIDFLIQR